MDETDIICVGAGVASLATTLRLLKRARQETPGHIPRVMVIEKGRQVGAHVLSGAILDPEPLAELLSEAEIARMAVESRVTSEGFVRLTARGGLRVPWVPPAMRAKGFPIISLSAFTTYLGQLCEAQGADIMTGFSAVELLTAEGRVAGVRIGDRGLDKHGRRKSIYQQGPAVTARVTVLGEGGCGVLTERLIEERGLAARRNSQTYAIGIKEVIELPPDPRRAGHILHTFGYPHDMRTYGGGFVYGVNSTRVAVGLITALDYREAGLNPHELFRSFKRHPRIRPFLKGGKVVGYGAKNLPEGGFYSTPALTADGVLLVGDCAGLLDSFRLKGIHIAIQSGIAAGDALFDCWKAGDFSAAALEAYPRRFQAMSGWKQMKRARNVRASFTFGQIPGLAGVGMSVFTGGLLPPGCIPIGPDWKAMKPKAGGSDAPKAATPDEADAGLQLDRVSDLFYSGTEHEEDQPCHLKIINPDRCIKECLPRFGAPCTLFCPAQVYSLSEEKDRIRIESANCLHCRTCTIKDPLENIDWNLPEAGGGPRYSIM